MIVLTGATGLTGRYVAEALAQEGVPLRALVRDPAKATHLKELGVDLVQGDLADRSSVDQALKGADKAFLLMGNVEAQLEYEQRFIDAASDAQLSQLVKMSAIGAQADHDNVLKHYHGSSEEHLKASGLPYTILRPNAFMQYMLYFKPVIDATGSFYVPGGDGQMGMIDVRDVAAATAVVLTQNGHLGKTYTLTGPDRISFTQIADAFTEVLGKPATFVDIPAADFEAQMVKTGQSDWTAKAVAEEFELMASGGVDEVSTVTETLIGRRPRTFKEMLQTSGM